MLANGTRIVCDPMPGLETLALSVVVGRGALHETPEQSGWAHLLEHMVFKAAGDRSAREIVEVIEAAGGHINAATGHDRTSFQVRAPRRAGLEPRAGRGRRPRPPPAHRRRRPCPGKTRRSPRRSPRPPMCRTTRVRTRRRYSPTPAIRLADLDFGDLGQRRAGQAANARGPSAPRSTLPIRS